MTGGEGARSRGAPVLLALSYVGFISLGLPDGMLGAAWPAMRAELGLPLDGAGQALLLATAGTVFSSLLSGRLLGRVATSTVLAASTALSAAALLLYAQASSWAFVLGAAVLAGFGGGAVDAALNGFVARHYDVWHMNWLHGCWGVGATVGPLTVAAALVGGRPWRAAYLALFLVQAALALAFVFTRSLWRNEPDPSGATTAAGPRAPEALRLTPAMRANVLFFFVYTGVEAGVGLWGASLLVITRGLSPPLASLALSGYWGMLMAGRFLLGALAERIGPARLLSRCCWIAVGALLVTSVSDIPLFLMVAALGILGLALAPIYPLVMHDTPRRFGANAARHLVGYQVAAGSAGIAILPWLVGFIAQRSSLLVIPPALAALAAGLVLLERRRRSAGQSHGELEGTGA